LKQGKRKKCIDGVPKRLANVEMVVQLFPKRKPPLPPEVSGHAGVDELRRAAVILKLDK
jgi:hypothetical protein